MNYRMKMTAEQVRAVSEWAAHGDGFADVLLDDGDDDRIIVGQGDERATFNTDGVQCCERCGALDGEELQGGACYSCGLGHEDDPEATAGACIRCGTEDVGRWSGENRSNVCDDCMRDDEFPVTPENDLDRRPTDDPRYTRGAH